MSMLALMAIPLVVIGVISAIVILVLRSTSQKSEQIQQVGHVLDDVLRAQAGRPGAGAGPFFGNTTATLRGRAVRLEHRPGTRNSPHTMTVDLPLEVRFEGARAPQGMYRGRAASAAKGKLAARFRTETWRDRLGRAIGLNRELSTGDADFDRAVYIESDAAKDDLDLVLGDLDVRRAIVAMLVGGAASVDLFRDGDSVRVTYARPDAAAAQRLPETVELLGRIADAVPACEVPPAAKGISARIVWSLALGIGGSVASLISAAIATGTFKTIEPGAIGGCILAGLCVWVLASAVSYAVVRGASDSLRAFTILVGSFVFAMPAASVATAIATNAITDAGPATEHTAKVTRLWVTTSKNSKTYHVTFESWRPDMRQIETTVSSSFYADLVVGDSVIVVTKPGRFGWEWIDELRRHRPRFSAP